MPTYSGVYKVCARCNRKLKEENFYTMKTGGRADLCKECLTAHIDNFDPSTFLWALEKMDVPYIPGEWNVLRDRAYNKDPKKMNGMSVFGKYLSKMKLKQWKDYGWADSERLQEEAGEKAAKKEEEKKEFEKDLKERHENGEISDAEYLTYMSTESQNDEYINNLSQQDVVGANNYFREENYIDQSELPDPAAQLTQEDKIYLAIKWGRLYKPDEWVTLEQKYTDMKKSFTINDSDSESALILICKTYLKMNQAADAGDYDTFQKLSRVYDSLRKGSKWTAAQNKEGKSDAVDSVGELVLMCEKQGFIPRYVTNIPQDKVDQTLADMNKYVYNLVTKDLGLGQQIETQLKKMKIHEEMKHDEETGNTQLTDQDHEDFYKSVFAQRRRDNNAIEEDI